MISHSTFTDSFSYSSKGRGRYLDDKTPSEHGEMKTPSCDRICGLRRSFIHHFLRVCPQTVDAKKLEKAEAKLKAKHERRNEKDSQKTSSQL